MELSRVFSRFLGIVTVPSMIISTALECRALANLFSSRVATRSTSDSADVDAPPRLAVSSSPRARRTRGSHTSLPMSTKGPCISIGRKRHLADLYRRESTNRTSRPFSLPSHNHSMEERM